MAAVCLVRLWVVYRRGIERAQLEYQRRFGFGRAVWGHDLDAVRQQVEVAARVFEGVLGPLTPGELDAFDAESGHRQSVSFGSLQVLRMLRAGASGPEVDGKVHPPAGPGALARLIREWDPGGDQAFIGSYEAVTGFG